MNAFETYDRYDFALSLLTGIAMSSALVLGAPLWAIVVIMFMGSVVMFIRHFNDIDEPAAPAPVREAHPKHVTKHSI